MRFAQAHNTIEPERSGCSVLCILWQVTNWRKFRTCERHFSTPQVSEVTLNNLVRDLKNLRAVGVTNYTNFAMPGIVGMTLYRFYRGSRKLQPRAKHIPRGAVFVVWAHLHGLHHGFYSSISEKMPSPRGFVLLP